MRRTIRPLRPKASVLVMTMIFITLLAFILLPVLQFFGQTSRMAHSTRASDEAFYAAEAGIARTLSYIFAQGGGAVTGIYDDAFNVDENNAFEPFGEWTSLAEGISDAGSDELAVNVRIWREPATGSWKIQSVGRSTRPKNLYRTVTVTIQAGSFARYAFFNSTSLSAIDGNPRWLAPGETFNGPVHTNRHLFVYGSSSNHLVFNSDVTIVGSEVLSGSSSYVEYNGLKDTNADYVELPSDLSDLKNAAAAGGIDLPGDDPLSIPLTFVDPVPGINNYKFVFNADGTITITNLDLETWLDSLAIPISLDPSFTVPLSATNGAIVVNDGNVFVSGTVNGRATVAALATDSSTSLIPPFQNSPSDGNLIIDGNLVYNTHPLDGGSYDISDDRDFDSDTVTDVLGLIAERNFALDHSVPTNCIVDAHMMLTGQASPNPDVRTWSSTTGHVSAAEDQDGAFYVEDGNQRDLSELWTGVPDGDSGDGTSATSGSNWKSGDIFMTGGVVHFIRGQTANSTDGYGRRYVFDQRLMKSPPPFYPLIPDLEIVGWEDVSSTEDPTT
jgi:hypothetical protein